MRKQRQSPLKAFLSFSFSDCSFPSIKVFFCIMCFCPFGGILIICSTIFQPVFVFRILVYGYRLVFLSYLLWILFRQPMDLLMCADKRPEITAIVLLSERHLDIQCEVPRNAFITVLGHKPSFPCTSSSFTFWKKKSISQAHGFQLQRHFHIDLRILIRYEQGLKSCIFKRRECDAILHQVYQM